MVRKDGKLFFKVGSKINRFFIYLCIPNPMKSITSLHRSSEQIILEQRAKLNRVLMQVVPGETIEIIRYGGNAPRALSSAMYTGGNKIFYDALINQFFNDACQLLKEGQRLRIQVLRGEQQSQ
jgi:hypothetical protein